MSKEDETKLWNKKMGHLHLKGMNKVLSNEGVKGIPKLEINEGRICGEC